MNKPDDIVNTPKIPLKLLNGLNSSWREILSELSPLMTDEMLQYIASADYGYEKEKCFGYLKKIIATQEPPSRSEFVLIECLELTRWSTPTNQTGHICRAFCCALLIILENESMPMGEVNDTLAPFIESIVSLEIAQYKAQNLVVWKILSDYNKEHELYLADEEDKDYVEEITLNPFLIYALLLMMVYNSESQKKVDRVIGWSIEMEKYENNIAPYYDKNRDKYVTSSEYEKTYLLGTTTFDQNHELWVALSEKMIQWKKYITLKKTSDKLDNIINCMVNKKSMTF